MQRIRAGSLFATGHVGKIYLQVRAESCLPMDLNTGKYDISVGYMAMRISTRFK